MDVTLEKTGELEGRLVVKIEEADYAARVKKELKEIGQTRQIPGFRKGHVDMAQLQKRFGKQVKAGVLNDVASDAALKYIEDNKIAILGQPIPAEENEMNLDDKDFTFVYEIGMMPELNMVFDQNVELDFYNIAVSDEMVAEQDKNIRMQAGDRVTTDTYGDRALVKGTIMQLAEDGQVKADGIQVTDGIVAPFLFKSKEEADKFIGKKVNDKVVFSPYNSCEGNAAELASMLNIDKEQAVEVKSDFEMSIAEIIVVKPAEHDQEFFDNVFGRDKVHNEEEFDKAIRNVLAGQFRSTTDYFSNLELKKYLMDTYGNLNLPKEFLKKWLKLANEENVDENTDMDKVYDEVLPDLTWQLIKEAIAAKFDVKIEEADIVARTKFIAQQQFRQYGIFNADEATIDNAAKHILADKNYRRHIVEEVSDLKLFAVVRENVTLNVEEVSLDDYRAYMAQHQSQAAEEAAEESAE